MKSSVMKALERFPQARDWLFNMRFKPVPRYDNGLLVEPHNQPFEASLVGEMLPQPLVTLGNGQTVLLDELLGSGFALLIQDERLLGTINSLDHPVWSLLAPTRVLLRFGSPGSKHSAHSGIETSAQGSVCAWVADPVVQSGSEGGAGPVDSGIYARPIRTHRDQVLLIRPDRYVAGAFFAEHSNAFAGQLVRAMGLAASVQ